MPIRRNDEAHFSRVPDVAIERSRMDRSKSHKFSGNVGDLIPIYWEQMLPGDTVTMDTSKVIRFQTMQTPIMDDLFADVFFFFVPERLVWEHWKQFQGENTSSAWIPSVTYTKPKLRVYDPRYTASGVTSNFNKVGTLLDYMGFPVGINLASSSSYVDIDATPFRAYALIADEWFRNQNVTDPLVISFGDSTVNATELTSETYIQTVAKGGEPFKVAKTFDLFTACLPSPQKGAAVELPLGAKAPVYATNDTHFANGATKPSNIMPLAVIGAGGSTFNSISGEHSLDINNGQLASGPTTTENISAYPTPNNLWADLSAATAATISDLRQAFQLQRYYERLARGGSRYTEQISNFFHVKSPDARLQRPEYLGGNRFPISVDQVANSAQTSSDALGDVGAFSRTVDYHSDFTYSSSEHGILLGLMCVRYNHTYCQGVPKKFTRFDKLDYFLPTFAHISEQPVEKSELYVGASGTFGYNEAWSQYRYAENTVAGEMRPYVSNSLGSWHLADDYNAAPTLSDAWMREDKTNVDRVLTVTSSAANQFWCDIYFKTYWTRPMPLYSVPGLMDHF